MKILICLQLVLLAGMGHGVVLPQKTNILLPTANTGFNNTPTTHAFVCGVAELDVVEINYTWYTPTGDSLQANGIERNQEGRFSVENSVQSLLHLNNISALTVSRLSYRDEGMYVCSASYTTSGSETVVQTGNATINIQLKAEISPIVDSITKTVSENVTMNCIMARYLRPDTDFLWRRGNEMISNGGRISIMYNDLVQDAGQLEVKTFSRRSSITISDLQLSDAGSYTCFVIGTDSLANVGLLVNEVATQESTIAVQTTEMPFVGPNPPSTAKPNSTEQTPSGSSFPIPAVGAIAAVLGIIVVVLIVLILLVSLHKRRKSSTVVLEPPARDLNDNRAYEPANASNPVERSFQSRPLPKYAVIDKHSISPAPPLPARPNTNLSMGTGNNSANSGLDQDRTPPGYDVPIHGNPNTDRSHSITIDPYYDNPDDVRKPPPLLPARNKSYYDEVELDNGKPSVLEPKPDNSFNTVGVPSPAVVLSGTLQRNPNPDFTYPPFSNGVQNDREHDYDQIYSEPIDPNIIRQDYEFESNESVPIPYSAIYEDPHPFQDSNALLRVTYKNVIEIKELGMGQFGHVILAKTVGLSLKDLKLSENENDASRSILVAIKKLRTDADGCLMEAFDKEVKFMARLTHDNVIRLLGVCTSEDSFIMMEYMENGDLNQFLTKQVLMPDTISGLQENEVTPIILLYIGVQIASGMHYLGSQRFVHRDLATRNCLVGRDFIVKISDFGMSRSLYESAYYRVQGTLVLPIRWMACETFYGKFSVKSDAWAFGVALWEIYTLGKVDPYDHMTDEDVIADAIRGQDRLILDKPVSCPLDVYDIMQRCWVHEPSMRADFGEIYSRLFIIYTRQAL